MGSDAKERLLSMNPWVDLDWPERCKQAAARIAELEAALSAATARAEAAEAEAARLREETGRARNALDNQLGHVFLMRKAVAAEDPLSQLLIRCDDMARDIRAALGGGQ